MAWTAYQQATETIKRAKRVMVVAPENPTPDNLATLAAVLSYLQAHDIAADGLVPNINPDKLPNFLPLPDRILPKPTGLRDLIIKLDVSKIPVHELAYNAVDGHLEISLTPKSGEWNIKDVSVLTGEDRHQAIIAIGFPDRQTLVSAFREPTDMIHRVPIINLDHEAKNEHWSAINLIDLSATATAEVAYGWFEDWDAKKIDGPTATALLAGLMANTNSFRSSKVTSLTLEKAARLMTIGADRERIVLDLWRTNPVSTLRLWGRALSRLEQDLEHSMVWTVLSKQDILETGTSEARLDVMVQELIAHAPDAKLALIFVEHDPQTTRLVLFAQPPYMANQVGRPLGLDGSHIRASGAIDKPLLEAKDHAVKTLRQQLR